MGIKVVQKVDFEAMSRRVQDATLIAMQAQIDTENTFLKVRTKRGEDADGNSFKPYAQMTLKRKKEQGKSLTSTWLEDSGHMLGSLHTKTYREGQTVVAEIFPIGGQDKQGMTASEKVKENMRTRPFFAFGKDQIARITNAINEAIKRIL